MPPPAMSSSCDPISTTSPCSSTTTTSVLFHRSKAMRHEDHDFLVAAEAGAGARRARTPPAGRAMPTVRPGSRSRQHRGTTLERWPNAATGRLTDRLHRKTLCPRRLSSPFGSLLSMACTISPRLSRSLAKWHPRPRVGSMSPSPIAWRTVSWYSREVLEHGGDLRSHQRRDRSP